MIVPHYQETLRALATKRPAGTAASGREAGHLNLTELLEDARTSGSKVAVLAIPMPDPYAIAPEILKAIADRDAVFVDARGLPGIEAGNFPDDYHLDPAGAAIVTEHLVKELGPRWWPASGDR